MLIGQTIDGFHWSTEVRSLLTTKTPALSFRQVAEILFFHLAGQKEEAIHNFFVGAKTVKTGLAARIGAVV